MESQRSSQKQSQSFGLLTAQQSSMQYTSVSASQPPGSVLTIMMDSLCSFDTNDSFFFHSSTLYKTVTMKPKGGQWADQSVLDPNTQYTDKTVNCMNRPKKGPNEDHMVSVCAFKGTLWCFDGVCVNCTLSM